MAKAIKLKNNTYLDSSGITHNRKILQNILSNLMGKSVSNTDYNNMTTTGIYYMGVNCTNSPNGSSYIYLFVISKENEGDLVQLAIPVVEKKIYIRSKAYSGSVATWSEWIPIMRDKPNSFRYSNTSIKNGGISFYKTGKMVQVWCNGDAGINSTLPVGETIYITNIDSSLTPAEPIYIPSWNNKGYLFLKISDTTVTIGNYAGAMSTPTNCGFVGCYMTNSD